MRRREFIVLFGAAATLPRALRAQHDETRRHVGVLMGLAADDPEAQDRIGTFEQALQKLGWVEGRNLQLHFRRGASQTDATQKMAAELVALVPDAILAAGGSVVGPLLQATRTIPIVFTQTPDPVAAGFVASLARPGGNATGFTTSEFGTSGKLMELLKEIPPSVTRVGVLRDPSIPTGVGQFASIESVASTFAVDLTPIDVRDPSEIERGLAELSRGSNGALIATSSASAAVHRDLIISLAARYQLPAVYSYRYFTTSGGLISYGPDPIDQFQRAAGYVDRILKGEKPADLPVQAPTKYELAINLKTAKALGMTIPQALLATADKVIE